MKLNTLTLKDKELFDRYLSYTRHELAVYAFLNIYIWKGLFKIQWQVIEESLCIFFTDAFGTFLYCVPLGEGTHPGAVSEVFKILDRVNKNKEVSRIENIGEEEVAGYQKLGYEVKEKSCDYLCTRSDLAGLVGNKFKSQRASYNHFITHYHGDYLPFSLADTTGCLKLYRSWSKARCMANLDPLYQGMLKDSFNAFKIMLTHFKDLQMTARVVKIGKDIKGLSFGCRLNADTFCIVYEITDLSIKGLAQFIFRSFCSELKEYTHINIMDDSGLENLKKVKLSYHPKRLIPAYIARPHYGYTH